VSASATPFRVPKGLFLKALGYEVHAREVIHFHESRARYRIPCAPARTSKSYAGSYDLLHLSMPSFVKLPDGKGGTVWRPLSPAKARHEIVSWIVAPSYQLAKEFDYLWNEVVQRQCFHPFGGAKVVEKHRAPGQGDMRIRVEWGRSPEGDLVTTLFDVKSATNPESCQAEEVDNCLMAEAAEQDEKMWEKYLKPRVTNLIAPTTPKLSAEWLYRMIQMGERDPSLGIESFAFTPNANPSYDWKRYWESHKIAEARALGKSRTPPFGHDCFGEDSATCKAMEDPWFAEQFGGRWTFDADRVLPFRWTGKNAHVLDFVPAWVPHGKWFVACDYGYLDPACAGFFSVGTDRQMVLAAEIYESKLDPQDFVNQIEAKRKALGITSLGYYGDPQKPEVESFMRKLGLPVFNVNKMAQRDRKSGFLRVVNALTPDPLTGQPMLRVLSDRCGAPYGAPKIIAEWKSLRRKAGAKTDPWGAAAFIGDDHGLDMTRYFLSADPVGAEEYWDANDHFGRDIARARKARAQMNVRRPVFAGGAAAYVR
jgi:hypothetical protein